MLDPDRLSNLINVEATANWRQSKADQFPDDGRNAKAAELLWRLAAEIRALEGSSLHLQIEAFVADNNSTVEVNNILRAIGFRLWPASGEELLSEVLGQLQRRCERKPQLFAVPAS